VRKRKLGKTGLEVPALGFGAMRFPVDSKGNIKTKETAGLLDRAIELGINYIDTAYPYHGGFSEKFLGDYLNTKDRKKIILATKLPPWNVNSRKDVEKIFEEQLRRLKTDYIDCYLLHCMNAGFWEKMKKSNALEFIDRKIEQGQIRFAGFSFHDNFKVFKEIMDFRPWSFCQIQYNYMDTNTQAGKKGLEYAAQKGTGIVIMEPLRGGGLADKLPEKARKVLDAPGIERTPAEWALKWLWNQPEISVVLSGMNKISQIIENCRVADETPPESLPPAELETIKEAGKAFHSLKQIPCASCGYCVPCPAKVNIPGIFSLYNDYRIYRKNREQPRNIYSYAMNKAEKADNCTGCRKCEKLCPQGIAISDWLQKCHSALNKN
jgi:hypothetical protein